jgi:NTP pyrophosphatase (non-canonical NTP hydrolase)
MIYYITECHTRAKEAGWWNPDNPRSYQCILMLIISEVAEAMEGARKGCPDDKLPHRDMFEVELADTFIRCCDLMGRDHGELSFNTVSSVKADFMYEADLILENRTKDVGRQLFDLTKAITSGNKTTWEEIIGMIHCIARINGYSLKEAVDEKMEYNLNRADHKPENRAKDGGKKW